MTGNIHSCSYYCDKPNCIKAQRDELREKLYQRTWVGLSDDEINDLVHSHDDFDGLWDFADAVEAKLKEKNSL